MSHDHDHDNELDPFAARVRALETILTQKGLIDPAAIDVIVDTYETKIGPRNGARVVAKAWSDPALRRLAEARCDGGDRIARATPAGRASTCRRCSTPTETHNLVVCTLCSCYPWSVLGLPPVWYKAPPYRSRAVIDPRGVLEEFGLTLPADKKIRVWDSTAELRYLVVPMRPDGTEGWSEERLADLVSARCDDRHRAGEASRHERAAGSRRADGFRAGRTRKGRAVFPCRLGKAGARRDACAPAPWAPGTSTRAGMRGNRCIRPTIMPPATTRSGSRRWRCCSSAMASSASAIWRRARRSIRPRRPKRVLKAENVPAVLAKGGPCDRPVATPARFKAGDRVRTKNFNPTGHTRLPRYARGKQGVIEAVRDGFVFPDSNAHGQGENPQWVYTVVFDGAGDLGRGRRPDADRLDRRLGELS